MPGAGGSQSYLLPGNDENAAAADGELDDSAERPAPGTLPSAAPSEGRKLAAVVLPSPPVPTSPAM